MDNNQDCSSENMISKNALLMVALISQKIATSQPYTVVHYIIYIFSKPKYP